MLSLKRLVKPALCLLLGAGPALAQDQVKPYQPSQSGVMTNQQLANVVAEKLQCCGQMKDYHVDVMCQGGVVELSGVVCDMGQRSMAARVASQVPGVVKVVNHVAVKHGELIQTRFADSEETVGIPPAPTATNVVVGQISSPATDPQSIGPVPTYAGAQVAPPAAGGEALPPAHPEPLPSFRAGMAPAGSNAMMPPPMPPYAWPTYAPYNNYSRVAYPIAYPAEAFPFIGPVHPFPKAPLGWRSVTLSFDDGHWWLKSNGQKRDWWILRYW
jgi:hypothetical protein